MFGNFPENSSEIFPNLVMNSLMIYKNEYAMMSTISGFWHLLLTSEWQMARFMI